MAGRGPWAISDRSGARFPVREMVVEPGTNYLVHKSESDGEWNLVTSPLNRITDFATLSGDPKPIPNARPDINHVVDLFMTDENNNELEDQYGSFLEVL